MSFCADSENGASTKNSMAAREAGCCLTRNHPRKSSRAELMEIFFPRLVLPQQKIFSAASLLKIGGFIRQRSVLSAGKVFLWGQGGGVFGDCEVPAGLSGCSTYDFRLGGGRSDRNLWRKGYGAMVSLLHEILCGRSDFLTTRLYPKANPECQSLDPSGGGDPKP